MKKSNVSTKDIQAMVLENKVKHNFNTENVDKEFLLLYGEVGEAWDAFRKGKPDFGEELADVAIYLLGIAAITGYDLGIEIEQKMHINASREYIDQNGVKVKTDEIHNRKE